MTANSLILRALASTAVGGVLFCASVSARTVPTLLEKLNSVHRSGYGEALATDGTKVLIGSSTSGDRFGVELYTANAGGTSFVLTGQVRPPVAVADQVSRFGRSLAVDGNLIAVGGVLNSEGAVFLYVPDPFAFGEWMHVRTLTDFNPDWGVKLDLSGALLAIGEQSSGNSGSVHVHRASQGGSQQWGLVKTLEAPLVNPGGGLVIVPPDEFGLTFDLEGTKLVAGRGAAGNGYWGVSGQPEDVWIYEASAGGTDQWGLTHTISAGSLGAARVGSAVSMDANGLALTGEVDGKNAVWFYRGSGSAWWPEGSFVLPDGIAPLPAASFGLRIAISGDDLVASYYDRFFAPDLRHVVAIFRRTGGVWSFRTGKSTGVLLDNANGSELSHLGRARRKSAMAMRNGILVSNALKDYGSEATRSGLVSLRKRDHGGSLLWGEMNEFHPPVSASPKFGAAMACHGDHLVVGDPGDDEGGLNSGAVYWFQRRDYATGEEWELRRKLKEATPVSGARFGEAVDVYSGSFLRIVIGAPGRGGIGGAFIYREGSGVGTPGLSGPFYLLTASAGDEVGAAVAVDANFVAIGSPGDGDGVSGNPGSVTIYRQIGASGLTSSQILRAQGRIDNGDRFGEAVSLSSGHLAVGAPSDEGGGTVQVYQYVSGGTPLWQVKREINEGSAGLNYFGAALDLNGSHLVVGAPGTTSGRGRARLFLKESYTGSPTGWGDVLTFPAPSTSGKFGAAVAIDWQGLVIGAPNDSTHNTAEGLAYLYRPRSGSGGLIWDLEGGVRGNVQVAGYNFGEAVALNGLNLIASSVKDDALTVDHGAAYILRAGSYEAWVGNTWLDLDAPGETGLLDDPDKDGQTNIEEFGYGTLANSAWSKGEFDFQIRTGEHGPLITSAWTSHPSYSIAGLKRTFEVGPNPAALSEPSTATVFAAGSGRYEVRFYGLLAGDPPPSRPKEFIRLKFEYPAY